MIVTSSILTGGLYWAKVASFSATGVVMKGAVDACATRDESLTLNLRRLISTGPAAVADELGHWSVSMCFIIPCSTH